MKEANFEEWIDLSTIERERTYVYPDMKVTIDEPQKLFVKESGSHKVVDLTGKCHYITSGFRQIIIDGEFDVNVTNKKKPDVPKPSEPDKTCPVPDPIIDLDDLAKKLKENTWVKRTRPYGPTPQWPSSPWWDNYPGYPIVYS